MIVTTTTPASESPASIPEGSWLQFFDQYDDFMVKVKWAMEVRGITDTLKAYAFAQGEIDEDTLVDIKAWKYGLLETLYHEVDLEKLEIYRELKRECALLNNSNLNKVIDEVRDTIVRTYDYKKLRFAAWHLTTIEDPACGLIIGSAMLSPRDSSPWYNTPMHPIDGKALIRYALRRFEQTTDLAKKHSELILDFSSRFPYKNKEASHNTQA